MTRLEAGVHRWCGHEWLYHRSTTHLDGEAVFSVQEMNWDKVAWHLGISNVPSEIPRQLFSESISRLTLWIGRVLSTYLLVTRLYYLLLLISVAVLNGMQSASISNTTDVNCVPRVRLIVLSLAPPFKASQEMHPSPAVLRSRPVTRG